MATRHDVPNGYTYSSFLGPMGSPRANASPRDIHILHGDNRARLRYTDLHCNTNLVAVARPDLIVDKYYALAEWVTSELIRQHNQLAGIKNFEMLGNSDGIKSGRTRYHGHGNAFQDVSAYGSFQPSRSDLPFSFTSGSHRNRGLAFHMASAQIGYPRETYQRSQHNISPHVRSTNGTMTKYCDTVTDASQIAGKHRVHKFQAPTGHGYNRGSSCLNHLDLSQSIYGQNVEKVYTGSGTPTTTRKSEQNYYKRAQNETSNHDTGGRVKPNTGTSLFRAQVIGMFMISSQCQVGWNGPVLLEVEFVESSSKILSVHVNKFSDKSFVAQAPIFRIRFASPTNGYRCFTIVPGPLFKSQTYAYWAFKFRDDEHVEFERILKNSQSLQI